MNIVSYRGPGAAGGVSSGLETAWNGSADTNVSWWFVADDALKYLTPHSDEAHFVTQVTEPVIKGHYAYCNNFLWPLMHDLPEFATYDEESRRLYRKLNLSFAQYIGFERASRKRYFVQDYQFALLPKMLGKSGGRSSIFWHIPWPKNVPDEYVEAISEIARGLLAAEAVGFHTNEYAENFMSFVRQYLYEYSVRMSDLVIYKNNNLVEQFDPEVALVGNGAPYVLRPVQPRMAPAANATKLVVQPLGIDVEKWTDMSRAASIAYDKVGLRHDERFVLSVDRADYTKAVLDRMQIIDRLMERREDLRGTVAFVQICGRSRAGVAAFDKYWQDCRTLCDSVNGRWQKGDWQPIRWIEDPLSAAELAALYPVADAMLVNPVRDGLNLTAKEFAACRHTVPGVLLLSPGAGAWHELGEYALPAAPRETEKTVDSIVQALTMSTEEKRVRTLMMLNKIKQNPLSMWWNQFVQASNQKPRGAVAAREREAISA